MILRPGIGLLAILATVWLVSSTLTGVAAHASGTLHTDAANPPSSASAPSGAWNSLNGAQRQALLPLMGLWPTMDETSKERWINVANRFSRLSPTEQQRMQERMTQWSRLPAQKRGEARLRFQQTRQLSQQERQEKWTAYQALSPKDRGELAQQARRKQQPVILSDAMTGPREQAQQALTKRRHESDSTKKSNVVPNSLHNVPAQVAVSPTLIKAGPGATTNLVNQRPSPPMHQQTGLPKIAATKGFVDPMTMLPKKGAQSAAVTALPAASKGR